MKRFHLLIALLSFCANAWAQTPFAIKNRVVRFTDPVKIMNYLQAKDQNGLNLKKYESNFLNNMNQNRQRFSALIVGDPANKSNHLSAQSKADKEEADPYKNGLLKDAEDVNVAEKLSTGIVISDDVNKLFPTIVGNVVNYRLRLWSRVMKKGPDKGDTAAIYLPLSIVSKLSGNTGNNSGTVNDAASFFGAPFTLRFSPNLIDVDVDNKKGRFVVGMHHDLRMLAIADTATDKVEAGFGYYGAIGFSYFNIGQVFNDEAKDWIDGKWSFSALFYFFKSGGKFNKAVFGDYKNKTLSGIECMLRFRTSSDANKRFNFFFGTNYGLTKDSPNNGKWDFRMGIGN